MATAECMDMKIACIKIVIPVQITGTFTVNFKIALNKRNFYLWRHRIRSSCKYKLDEVLANAKIFYTGTRSH